MSWKKKLEDAFKETGDNFAEMVTTLTDEKLEREFDSGYGVIEGEPFTAWGEKFVYFPICYDGAEWVGYAPRNPCEFKTEHMGGSVNKVII